MRLRQRDVAAVAQHEALLFHARGNGDEQPAQDDRVPSLDADDFAEAPNVRLEADAVERPVARAGHVDRHGADPARERRHQRRVGGGDAAVRQQAAGCERDHAGLRGKPELPREDCPRGQDDRVPRLRRVERRLQVAAGSDVDHGSRGWG